MLELVLVALMMNLHYFICYTNDLIVDLSPPFIICRSPGIATTGSNGRDVTRLLPNVFFWCVSLHATLTLTLCPLFDKRKYVLL